MGYGPKRPHVLFPLLLHRVPKWCVWAASSNVVSIETAHTIYYDSETHHLNLGFVWSKKVSIQYERSHWLYVGIQSAIPADGISNVQCCLHIIHWIHSIPVPNDIDWRSENENRCCQWMWQKPIIETWHMEATHRIHSAAFECETVRQPFGCLKEISRFHRFCCSFSDWSTIFKVSLDQYLRITLHGPSEQFVAVS